MSDFEVVDIRKTYKKKQVLDGISFEAQRGESIALVGRNGSGKTTLLRILSGALKPDSGELSYFGESPLKNPDIFYDMCGYVPQGMPLVEELSVYDNLKLWCVPKKVSPEKSIEMFELQDIIKQPVKTLSDGMKRRITIALAMLHDPPVLLLDEPTAALDLYFKGQIADMINRYKASGGIVIMSTHDEKEMEAADIRLDLQDGKLLQKDESKVQ